jgi:hypothetical protein
MEAITTPWIRWSVKGPYPIGLHKKIALKAVCGLMYAALKAGLWVKN